MKNIFKTQMMPGLAVLCGLSLASAAPWLFMAIAAVASGSALLAFPLLLGAAWSVLWAYIWGSWGASAWKKRQIIEHDLRSRGLE